MVLVNCIHDTYEIESIFKQTQSSIIYLARNKIDQEFLIKMPRDKALNYLIKNEYMILSKLKHRYIQKVLDNCEIGNKEAIILEYNRNYKPLHKTINIDIKAVIRVITMLLEAVEYIHKNKIVHRDIKPPNILIDPKAKELRLIDFAAAQDLNNPEYAPRRIYSVGGFTSPEQYNFGGAKFQYDIWSISATILYLLTKKIPLLFLRNYPKMSTKIDLTRIKTELIYLYDLDIAEKFTELINNGLVFGSKKGFESVKELKSDLHSILLMIYN